MKIFGDDGFRDKSNKNLLNKIFLNNFFDKLNYLHEQKKIKNIVIGHDTRISKNYILDIILKNLKFTKTMNVINHPISTPGLQYISKLKNCFGIMITASHFSHEYNGFKFFNNGLKLKKKDENYIEKQIKINKKYNLKILKKTKITYINAKHYINYINNLSKFSSKEKILIDCANGSLGAYCNRIKILKKTTIVNKSQNGKKINFNCGSNFLDKNLKKNFFKKYNYCIAFDGDADRLLISKKKYGIIEAEKLALIFTLFFLKKKKIESIVSTEITNPWFHAELNKIKIKNIISKVGDRNVVEKKMKNNSFFGFETSGHFSFLNFMDGLIGAINFIKIINENNNLIDYVLKKKINYKKKIFAITKTHKKKLKIFLRQKKFNNIKFTLRSSIWNNYDKLYIFYEQKDLKIYYEIKKFLFNKSLKIKIKN